MASRNQQRLLEAGAPAPDFRLPLLAGGEASLADLLSGGPVLLAFFKISCPVCQMTFPVLERLYGGGKLRIYGVSQNDAEDTRDFNREFGVKFPVLLDSEDHGYVVSNAYGISSVPTLFLVGENGIISRVIQGWRKKEVEWLGGMANVIPFRNGDSYPEWKAG